MTDRAVDVSIVIPTRNRATRLEGTLRALTAIRSSHSWEIVFVDNASTDATAHVIQSADDCGGRLRYVRADRVGSGAARDYGWRQARGRIVAFTDDDCYPAPDYVDAIVDAFARHPGVGCIGGRILLHDPQDARVTIDERTTPIEYASRSFIAGGTIQGANIAHLRSVLERVGGYDHDFGAGTPFSCEDIDVVAATLWSGSTVRYEPGPTVAHHHRRRAADIPALFKNYDAGRGAYHAKYLLRPDTRLVYLRELARLAPYHVNRQDFIRAGRELRAGYAYLRHRRAYGFLACAVPVALVWYCSTAVSFAAHVLKRRLVRLRFAAH